MSDHLPVTVVVGASVVDEYEEIDEAASLDYLKELIPIIVEEAISELSLRVVISHASVGDAELSVIAEQPLDEEDLEFELLSGIANLVDAIIKDAPGWVVPLDPDTWYDIYYPGEQEVEDDLSETINDEYISANYATALQSQAKLLRYWESDAGARLLSDFLDNTASDEDLTGDDSSNGHPATLFSDSDVMWVSSDICEHIEAINKKQEPAALYSSLLPSRSVSVIFERPLKLTRKHTRLSCVTWVQTAHKNAATGGVWRDGIILTCHEDDGTVSIGFWPFGVEMDWRVGSVSGAAKRALMVLLQFIEWQRFAAPRQPVGESDSRSHRAGAPSHAPSVTVIRFNPRLSSISGSTSGSQIEWSYRWPVRGHWRRQPYPSEGVTRRIWISEYVKGPRDKPLQRKPRLFVVDQKE